MNPAPSGTRRPLGKGVGGAAPPPYDHQRVDMAQKGGPGHGAGGHRVGGLTARLFPEPAVSPRSLRGVARGARPWPPCMASRGPHGHPKTSRSVTLE